MIDMTGCWSAVLVDSMVTSITNRSFWWRNTMRQNAKEWSSRRWRLLISISASTPFASVSCCLLSFPPLTHCYWSQKRRWIAWACWDPFWPLCSILGFEVGHVILCTMLNFVTTFPQSVSDVIIHLLERNRKHEGNRRNLENLFR